jgi:hypothetical protein
MSQITLNIIAADVTIHGQPHASFGDTVVAALSAEPETLDDLRTAIARFEHHDRDCFGGFHNGFDHEPYDAGICYIDLTARLVAYESTYSHLSSRGSVRYHDGNCATRKSLPYHVSDDWEFSRWVESFEPFANDRRRKRAARPPLDARKLLYGPRLAEFLVKECFAARGGTIADDDVRTWSPPAGWDFRELAARFKDGRSPTVADAVAEIHARWLLTPRKDLAGCTPRELLLEKQDHLSGDMQDRCEAWSMLDRCPPPLSTDSHAYRFAGFGSHENYVYYELVRDLLWECWERVVDGHPGDGPVEVQMANEAERLHACGLRWLDQPNSELSGIPSQIIENERRRIPEAGTGHDAMVDEDCPCCQAMAEMPGPFFWHLDGCNNDDDFAFSFHATREEWEDEQREWYEIDRRHLAKKRDDDLFYSGAFDDFGHEDDDDDDEWTPPKFHFSTFDPNSVLAVMQFGYDLAGLIAELQKSSDSQPLADSLQRHFGNLRETVENKQSELREPVTDRFGEELLVVAATRTDLAARCDHLAEQLKNLAASGAFDGPRWDEVPF